MGRQTTRQKKREHFLDIMLKVQQTKKTKEPKRGLLVIFFWIFKAGKLNSK